MMIKALLMDLDGVLVDMCDSHWLSFNLALLEVCNFEIGREEHDTSFNGLPTHKKIDILVDQQRVIESQRQEIWQKKQAFTIDAINSSLSPDEDKIALHQWTILKNIKTVCVTNSITETATLMLDKTGQLPYMHFLITNEMVNNPKPHPEGYIRAMIKLGIMPDECIIVEDSDKGLAAARATGAHVCHVSGPADVSAKVRKMIQELQ
jgi:beta-phosphoglucomutase